MSQTTTPLRAFLEQPHQDYDVICIGSGLGSLTTANFLAREGKKVLILEMHGKPGGFTHTFKRKTEVFDVGVHYIGEVHREKSFLKSAFNFMTDKKLQWADMGSVYDVIEVNGRQFPFFAGENKFIEELSKQFPNNRKEIERYVHEIKEIAKLSNQFFIDKMLPKFFSKIYRALFFKNYINIASQTTHEYLSKFITNSELLAVLTGQWGDYGLAPKQSSIIIHAMVAKHYLNGAAYPIGGSLKFWETMSLPLITRGSKVVVKAKVNKVIVENNSAIGVQLVSGEKIFAKKIISSIGLRNTLDICPQIKDDYQELKKLNVSSGHFSLYIVTSKPLVEIGLPTANLWHYQSENVDQDVESFLKQNKDPFKDGLKSKFPFMFYSFASNKDTSHKSDQGVMEVITLAPFEWFERWSESKRKERPAEYEEFKQKMTEQFFEQCCEQFPTLKENTIHYELSTPLTTKHYCNYQKGEIYGLDHTPQRFLSKCLRPKTRLKNFYLTGQDIVSVGVGGAVVSGILTASSIMKKNYMKTIIKYTNKN